MVHRGTILQFVAVVVVLVSLSDCHRKGQAQTSQVSYDFKDLLLASMQDTISALTDLVTQQTLKITELTASLNGAMSEMEQVKTNLAVSLNGAMSEMEQVKTNLTVSLNGAMSEMEQLKINLSRSDSTTTGLVEGLRTGLSQQIEDLTTKSSQEKEALNTSFSRQIDELATKSVQEIEALNDKVVRSESNTTTKLDELRNELARAENGTTEKIAEIQNNVTTVTSGVEDLVSKVAEVEDVAGTWPEGSYCILGSGGSCPTGFTRYYGYAKRIWQYHAAHSSYMRPVTFGDSSVACHGSCTSGNGWNVDLIITSCCK